MPRSMKEIREKADFLLERSYRKHLNRRVRKAMLDYEKKGWKLTTRGFPHFIAQQLFTGFRAVWVPDKSGCFTIEQRRLQAIFRAQNFDVRTVDLEAKDFCAPEGSKEG
jgi:hypothetical protein